MVLNKGIIMAHDNKNVVKEQKEKELQLECLLCRELGRGSQYAVLEQKKNLTKNVYLIELEEKE